MAREPRAFTIDADSELGRALDEKNGRPIVLLVGEKRFRVTPEDSWADYDPEKVRERLRRFAGMISPEEGDRIIEGIYHGREEGTRPIDRP